MVGITAAHNAVRAAASNPVPKTPLGALKWSPTIAAWAQEWADKQAMTNCSGSQNPHHPSADLQAKGYGENIAFFGKSGSGSASKAEDAVNGWAAEKSCWTYGKFMTTDSCNATCIKNLNSNGCGHYTALVWSTTTEVGCGVATCKSGVFNMDIWVCNYSKAGNWLGQAPY